MKTFSGIAFNINRLKKSLIYPALFFVSQGAYAQSFSKIPLNEDDILLLSGHLNGTRVASTIDAYPYENTVLVALEPLFESLHVKYQIYKDKIHIWKGSNQFTLSLAPNVVGNFKAALEEPQDIYWADDGFYTYLDKETLANFFDIDIDVNEFQLKLSLKTEDYLFPLQVIAEQNKKRLLSTAMQQQRALAVEAEALEITIPDQYRLFTIPHGRVNMGLALDNESEDLSVSTQLTSDLLYHSADLTLGKINGEDLSTRLKLSRYKEQPDALILDAFDSYSFGDVSGFSNSLTTTTSTGLGVVFQRKPEQFRRRNLAITLEESAPPGWEAELFHNNRFLAVKTVPDNGLIIFEDVETQYGNNYYQIKLFGPYGEEEVIEKYVDLTKNALDSGAIAYDLYALDNNHRLIDDQSNADRGITNIGGTLDYGVNDYWQIGAGFSNIDLPNNNSEQSVSLKNALSFPGFLLENDFAFNSGNGYAQLTTITGNSFNNQHFSLAYESANDFESNRISTGGGRFDAFNASYSGSLGRWNYSFNGTVRNDEFSKNKDISNRLSRSINKLYLSHTLRYNEFEQQQPDPTAPSTLKKVTNNTTTGTLGLSGRLSDQFRLSGNIQYDPSASSPILDSSTMTFEYVFRPYNINNYLTARYQPLADSSSSNKWQLSHRVSWDSKQFQYTFSSNHNADNSWSFNAGIRFFFGYDYYNDLALFRSNMSSSTATLNVHSYLDRHANGIPDPLDYDVAGVSFNGVADWEGIKSGDSGHTILHGVPANGAFRFGGVWKEGSSTINKDYVVYTHPGAYLDVNMPLNLNTEITGFVQRTDNETPMRNVRIILSANDVYQEEVTDEDGYYAFLDLPPGQYQISIAPKYLIDHGFTGEVIGYTIKSPKTGGFVELDTINLDRKLSENDSLPEKIVPFTFTEDNSARIVRADQFEDEREFFNLPIKRRSKAPYTLTDEQSLESTAVTKPINLAVVRTKPIKKTMKQKQGILPVARFVFSKNKEKPSISKQVNPRTSSPLIDMMTLQLGVYSDELNARAYINNLRDMPLKPTIEEVTESNKTVFKVVVGQFKTKQQAQTFADEHLGSERFYVRPAQSSPVKVDDTETTLNEQWVIQFYASKTKIEQLPNNSPYHTVDQLFVATKNAGTSAELLYCLLSESFGDKAEALKQLKASGLQGWVTKRQHFKMINQLK